jgi:hypothetical protein
MSSHTPETAGTCTWCGCTALCTREDETLTCAACYPEPNPQPPVTHEALRLFTPLSTLRGQMTL